MNKQGENKIRISIDKYVKEYCNKVAMQRNSIDWHLIKDNNIVPEIEWTEEMEVESNRIKELIKQQEDES